MTFNRYVISFILAVTSFRGASAAPLNVVTTVPELSWMVKAIGQEHVNVTSLLTGKENPHYVDAVPDYIRLVADADVVCVVGLDLEVGYMPAVLSRSGNATVQPGGKGYCEASKSVQVLDKAQGAVDRSMGDIHPNGNPHFYLSPRALAQAGKEIAAALIRVAPDKAATFTEGLAKAATELEAISKDVQEIFVVLTKVNSQKLQFVEYHREFIYYFDEFGLTSMGSIEEKPGVAPSAGRIADVALSAKSQGVLGALAPEYAPQKILDRFSSIAKIPAITVTSLKRTDEAFDALRKHHIDRAQMILSKLGLQKDVAKSEKSKVIH